jgi:hypothetical protein
VCCRFPSRGATAALGVARGATRVHHAIVRLSAFLAPGKLRESFFNGRVLGSSNGHNYADGDFERLETRLLKVEYSWMSKRDALERLTRELEVDPVGSGDRQPDGDARPKKHCPQCLCLDKGYDYAEIDALVEELRFTGHIAPRPTNGRPKTLPRPPPRHPPPSDRSARVMRCTA